MERNVKVMAYYLPQYHSIPENDAVWGAGFTEWTNVKKATSLFEGHYQPRIPLNGNYYNLLDLDTLKWQVELAKENGVFGFSIYHYWFSGLKLLNKPLEMIRDNPSLSMPYNITWANESWSNAWSKPNQPKSFLIQKYGNENEWRQHYEYFAGFFKDPNYIKTDNKPELNIYRPEQIPKLKKMLTYWNDLAVEDGFDGISFGTQQVDFTILGLDHSLFDRIIKYQPIYSLADESIMPNFVHNVFRNRKKLILERHAPWALDVLQKLKLVTAPKKWNSNDTASVLKFDYNRVADVAIGRKSSSSKSVPGFFVGFDNTARIGNKGIVIQSTPQEFRQKFRQQLLNWRQHYNSDYLYMFAWNEWGEGGYLEPDEEYGLQYLEILNEEVKRINEVD